MNADVSPPAVDRFEKVRGKYAAKARTLGKSIRTASERVQRERAELNQASMTSIFSFGASVLGAFLGNKTSTRAATSKATSVFRGATRAAKKKAAADRAEEALAQLRDELEQLEPAAGRPLSDGRGSIARAWFRMEMRVELYRTTDFQSVGVDFR